MNVEQQQLLALFVPTYQKKLMQLEADEFKFVQYTSAEAVMNIIRSQQVWMRNAQCMNDYLEIEHGYDCLIRAYNSQPEGKCFKEILENLYPGLPDEISALFDSWMPHLRHAVYITCFSEHPSEENRYGRLSMWRAYGGDQPVAIVLKKTPFLSETDELGAYSAPVIYQEPEQFREDFGSLAQRMVSQAATIEGLGREGVKNTLFHLFKVFVLCVKHPGFAEEREWRAFYAPALGESQYLESDVVSVRGVPQTVYKIPLRDIPEIGFYGAAIPDVLDRIIIGPSDQQLVIGKTFVRLLEAAGCVNAVERVHYSGIPLR